MKKIVLVGIGNDLRGDDGIGVLFVKDFKSPKVDKVITNFLDLDIAEKIKNYEIVIFVDASVKEKYFCLREIQESDNLSSLSHHLSIENVFHFTKKFYNPYIRGYVLEIGAVNFGFENSLSKIAKKNMVKAKNFLKTFIDNNSSSS